MVNAAAGAVGSAVGQIAKIKGCRVVGKDGVALLFRNSIPVDILIPTFRLCGQRCKGGLPEEPGV